MSGYSTGRTESAQELKNIHNQNHEDNNENAGNIALLVALSTVPRGRYREMKYRFKIRDEPRGKQSPPPIESRQTPLARPLLWYFTCVPRTRRPLLRAWVVPIKQETLNKWVSFQQQDNIRVHS
jgi:hypothetical protein